MNTNNNHQAQGLARYPWLPGAVASRLEQIDWSRQTLGPPETWPRDLDPLLQLCLLSGQPAALLWGSEGAHIFNQAWADRFALGSWEAAGTAFVSAWSPVWKDAEQIYRRAAAGEGLTLPRTRIFLADEAGVIKECYFSVAASTVALAGGLKATLITAQDISRNYLAQRRVGILRKLASEYRQLNSVQANCQWFLSTLVSHEEEVPFAAAYWIDERQGARARRLCTAGPAGSAEALPRVLDLKAEPWRLEEALAGNQLTVVPAIPEELGIQLSGLYPEPVRSFAIYPISKPRHNFPSAVLLLATSPRLSLDDDYLGFFKLLGISFRQLVTGIYTRQRWEEANAALISSEKRYRAVVEAQSEMVCRFRPDGTILFANGAYARAANLTPEEMESYNFWDFVAEEDRPHVEAMLAKITPDNPEVHIENQFEIAGRYRWTRWSNRGLTFDETGRPIELQSVGMDISDRRQAEEALKNSEEQLRLALQGAKAGAWSLDVATGKTFWSQGFRSLYGYGPEAIPRFSTWISSVHPDDRAWVRQAFRSRPSSTTSEYQQEFRIIHPERGERWILALGRVERDQEGESRRITGINIDITERKTVEQALRESEERLKEADRRKDEFLATLAHELRNPLAPIRNSLEVIRLSDDKAALKEARAVMERQLAHMVHLVNDLLDLSRISRGKVTLRKEPVSISAVVDQAVEICRPLVDEAGHRLYISLPAEPVFVRADSARLAQVFANLLSNAIKFTAPGGEISLMAEVDDKEVTLRVQDNGAGIPPHMLNDIFEMFIQADSSQHYEGGLGIGLSLVKWLVEMHDGRVEANSAGEGQGSEFVVRLPVYRSQGEQTGSPRPGPQDDSVDQLRVLVVDDNQDAANSMATMLSLMGHETRVAFDGIAALEAAEEFRPDVALLDIGMPRLNGYQTARHLRQQSWARNTMLVALTGWGQAEDRRRSREAGFDHHLVKPVELQVLNELLSSASSVRAGLLENN